MRWYNTKHGATLHRRSYCAPAICAVHNPSKDNPMRDWDFTIRLDKYGVMERYCTHGIGHTDPDSMDWMHSVYDEKFGSENVSSLGIHGCDTCCWE